VSPAAADKWEHPHVEEEWKLAASCRGEDPDLWFPRSDGQRSRGRAVQAAAMTAKAICGQCPVRPECLAYALACDIRYGIWGGCDEGERGRLTGRRMRI
jgi:WhiB family redox-sensing transcriptional regulator